MAIGDELLSGFTLDTNSHWISGRLRLLGHPVKRVSQIRDRQVEIVEAIQREIADPDLTHVFCTGGLGPTPDDRTFEALAAALGRDLVVWDEVRLKIEKRLRRMLEVGLIESAEPNGGHLRMATIPARPEAVLRNRVGSAPGVVYRLDDTFIYALPGVPAEMKAIFGEEIEPAFLAGGTAGFLREMRLSFALEGRFYHVLRELETSHPDVSVGSYPNFESKELVLRCQGADQKRVEDALGILRRAAIALGYKA